MEFEVLGEDVGVRIEQYRIVAPRPGPRVSVLGGVHGDELEGILATSMLIDGLSDLLCGELRVVSRSNPSAVQAGTRESADDGKNLARCFPGDPSGTYTDRVAHVLTEQVIDGVDALIDLHSGGRRYSMPFFAGYVAGLESSERSAEMTDAFAAPLSWRHDAINPGRSISAAAALDVPAIYVESGQGGGSLDHAVLHEYVTGVKRVLATFGMVDRSGLPDGASRRRRINGGDGNTDASLATSHAGYCLAAVAAGDVVVEGQLIAEIRDERGSLLESIVSPCAGLVASIRVVAEVFDGDGIVMIATDWEDTSGGAG